MMKKTLSLSVLLMVFLLAATVAGFAADKYTAKKPLVLQLESFTPVGTPPGKIFHHIFDGLKEATGGIVVPKYHEAGVMGKPSETLERVQSGLVDAGVLVAGYFPGVFPMTEVFELPIHYPDATYGSKAWIEMWKKGYFAEETSDVKIITAYMIGPYNLLSTVPVRQVSDFEGMKLTEMNSLLKISSNLQLTQTMKLWLLHLK